MTPADIRAARKRLSLSQEQLASRMGVSRSLVEKWERGVREISKAHEKLLRLLAMAGE